MDYANTKPRKIIAAPAAQHPYPLARLPPCQVRFCRWRTCRRPALRRRPAGYLPRGTTLTYPGTVTCCAVVVRWYSVPWVGCWCWCYRCCCCWATCLTLPPYPHLPAPPRPYLRLAPAPCLPATCLHCLPCLVPTTPNAAAFLPATPACSRC